MGERDDDRAEAAVLRGWPAPVEGWGRWRLWATLWRERRRLAQLDARALADLGLDPIEAAREARRPFWDMPDNRRPPRG